MVASVLATTGELARVAGPGLRAHIGEVMPLIIEAIQDTAGGHKRLTAVSTLGQVLLEPLCCREFMLQSHSCMVCGGFCTLQAGLASAEMEC